MLRNTIMIIALLTIGSISSFAQNDYYWSGGKQIFMDKTSTKKFVVVDSSIVNQNELDSALGDSSLIITGFFERNIIPQINLRDSAYLNNNFAIIESRDSIKPETLLNNNYIHYVSDYYQIGDHHIGTSNLFYVKLSNMQDTIVLDSISTAYNINVLGNFSNSPSWFILECTEQSAGNVLDMANMFYESGLFVYSHPNLLNNFHPTCTNDPYFHKQWGLNNNNDHDNIDINACDAWSITKGDANIVIAVLDSGIKLDHPDLTNVDVSLSYDLMSGTNPSTLYEDIEPILYNHGTNCAGIIGAQHNGIGVAGIAPNCTLMSLSLKFGAANQDQIYRDGIVKAMENGADIISNSWETIAYEDIINDAIDSAVNNGRNGLGCVIVQSSGNGNSPNISHPSYRSDVIAVGAIDSCGIRITNPSYNQDEFDAMCGSVWELGDGSNFGDGLSIVAPGSDVPTTNIVGDNYWVLEDYVTDFNGTSAAAPHVSGVAALLLSVKPDLTHTEVKDAIESTAQKIRPHFYDYNVSKPNGMWNEKLGYGMVDAYAALEYVFCHDDVFIESTDNITWTSEKNLCDNLIVEGELTINAPVHIYTDLPQITIQNGGHLIFDTGSELYHWEDENYAGNIYVEAGSTLEFKNGADIVLAENGKIMVNHDANNSGELVFNNGAALTLQDNNTNLEIAGNLHIASNATFSFSGDGYIKFSNPGGDATNNIFCGSGASFVLQGSGKNDKIMEVQQSSVRFPADLSNLELRDGKIEMGQNKRMLAEGSPAITFDNMKITSDIPYTNNNHRSFFFWGQPNITINNCVFEYGQYGLYNYTYGGASLSVTNSEFNHNQTGLYMYDKGLALDNCDFNNNTLVGLHADNMSWTSALENCNFQYNNNGIDYHGSAGADLNFRHSTIQNSTNDGVKTDGSFDLRATCTNINDNQNGIYTEAGTRVRIDRESKNNFSGNVNAIYLDYGTLAAKYGKNNLQSTNYAVLGETPMRCAPPSSPELEADYNLWDGTNSPAYLQNHKLWVLNCNQLPVNITDPNPQAQMCLINPLASNASVTDDELSQNSDVLLSGESSSGTLSTQVDAIYEATNSLNTASDCQQLIIQSITLMENSSMLESAEVFHQRERIWSNIHNIIDNYYEIIGRDNEHTGFNQSVDQVMQLNEQLMLDADAISYYEYALDNALLERLRGNFDEALLLLDLLIPELEGMERETAYVNRWACHIEAEREAALGNLSPDEFMAAIETCNASYENIMENLPDASENETGTETPAPEIHIVPNPNNGNFTVEISECTAGSSLRISNLYAQPVYTETFTDAGTQTVQITGLTQGQYTLYYLENDVVISSVNVIVE